MNIYNALIYKKLYGGGGGGEIEVESLTATENKTYNAGEGKAYNPVVVAIPEPTLISKNITANGTYNASDDNADGYSSVSINVPLPSNAYLLKSIEREQVATFTDGTDNFLKSLEVAIEPVQSGSGEPSPSNIRPISGWSAVDVTRCGKNLATESSGNNKVVGSVRKGYTYTFSVHNTGTIGFNLKKNNNSGDFIVSSGSASSDETISVTFTADDNYNLFVNGYGSGGTIYGDNASNYQLELGSTATTYEPYNGQTYTLDLDGTRYGGKLDVVNGVLTVTHGFISSYNGETLPSTWISDRDVYAEDTTPTIGAEVCYKLATPQTIQLTPTIIKSLQGENNFFASTGEIEILQYWGKEVTS